ncbi:hypothetical protein GC197_11080 [bacterium]|nr:hypothetical protein [bacterium]
MRFSLSYSGQLILMLSAAMFLMVYSSGCSFAPALDASEVPTKDYVEGKGGSVELEDGHIVVVWLESANLTDADFEKFAGLSQLKSLHLNYNGELTNGVFKIADKMPALTTLELAETKITQRAADKFRDEHPDMSVSGPGV